MVFSADPATREIDRLNTLQRYQLLDTVPEERFERIVKFTSDLFGVPICLISLVDENRQWFKAKTGLDVRETARELAFCAHTIRADRVLCVPDTHEDDRFRTNDLVTGGPRIRFYAGAPLKAANGHNLGTLCIIDHKPRPPLTDEEEERLKDLAAIVVDEFELRQTAGVAKHGAVRLANVENRLVTTENTLDLFIEFAPAAIAMVDRDMTYLAVSKRWCVDYKLDAGNIVGRNLYDVSPSLEPKWKDRHDECLKGNVLSGAHDAITREDGTTEWLRWEMRPWFERSGEIGGMIIFTEFVTARKRVLDELQKNRDFLTAVLENIQDGIVACDAAGKLSLFNHATKLFHGLDSSPLQPDEWAEHYDLYEADGVTPMVVENIPLFRAFQGEQVKAVEMVIAPKSKGRRHIIASGQPLYDKNGVKLGAVASMHDVTEQKAIEAQYYQAQKMEAVGQLTGGLAHDFNNLLAVILGNLQLLKRANAADEKSARRTDAAIEAVQRGAELTKRLLAFSRKQALEPKSIIPGDLIHGMEDMIHRCLGQGIALQTHITDDIWTIKVDANQLESAVLNLCINARDAMGGTGDLTIEASNITFDLASSHLQLEMPPGRYVAISVTDTGCGIPANELQRIFEPFFTTKGVGEGSGLGLSMVYGFIKQSGGHIKVYSEVGRGTTLKMFLPAEEVCASLIDTRPRAAEPAPLRETNTLKTILVVEDNAAVREVAIAMLEDIGYNVWEAEDGPSALSVLADKGAEVDLLFTDIVMPGMTGPALAKEAVARFPSLKVLYTSGYAEAAILREGEIGTGQSLVSKPIQYGDLELKVRDALGDTMPVGQGL